MLGAVQDDQLERAIAVALLRRPRATIGELALSTGVPRARARGILSDLVTSRRVQVSGFLNQRSEGHTLEAAFYLSAAPSALKRIAAHLLDAPAVTTASLLAGPCSVMAEGYFPSEAAVAEFVAEDLGRISGLAAVETALYQRRLEIPNRWQAIVSDPGSTRATLDELDRSIVAELSRDGRVSTTTIAVRAGVSEGAVRKRLARLQATGQLLITAIIDPQLLGHRCEAFLLISVEPGRLSEAADRLATAPETGNVSLMAGRFPLLVRAYFPTPEAITEFVAGSVGQIPGIRAVEIWRVLLRLRRAFLPLPDAAAWLGRGTTSPSTVD